ncbi:uncharacterized protein [Onthophagus taurus]|uniref:uncharacterized protein n=1 Tax=Onthophagus taurus TaxID=166361 RepID=UPI000C202509|nr:uncharacterized protein LOC111429423 [Onthophagus taurus]
MKVLFYQFISVYCLIKNLLGIPPGLVKKSSFPVGLLIQLCLFTLTIATMLSSILLYITLQTFLFCMDLWLMWKYGKNYGGRLKGQDAQLESTEEKVSISVMVILNHNEDNNVLYKRLEEMAKNVHNSFYKLSCAVEKCLGYPYYIKNQVTDNDCLVYAKVNDKEYLTRDELLEYIQKNCMINVINQKRLWFGRIFTQPVKWNKKSETMKQTAIMLVFRHCLADGVSLIGLLKNFMIREENPEVMKLNPKYTTKPNFSFDNAYIYRNPLTCGRDEPKFDIPNSERNIVFYIEDEIKYVPLVKKIKNKLGVGFTEILIAGLTASLADVLARRGKTMDKCQTAVLFRPINEDLVSIVNGTYNYSKLTNDSAIVMINTPVTMEKGTTMLDRVKSIGIELDKAKYSVDSLVYYAIGNLGHLLPAPILKHAMIFVTNISAGATNVGGLKAGTIAGCEVEAAMSYIAFYYKTCFRLSIFSKGDRFQLALTMRENVVYNRKDAQEVIDNIFTFVDNLSEELQIQ